MATEARKFQVGVFVITATAIGVGALVWLGASRFFEKTERFVTYFSESVQGLEAGAAVKYRGVPAGRVQEIRVAPDGQLIEVVMSVDTELAETLKRDVTLRAEIALVGITGLRYVEIDRQRGQALREAPPLTFEPPYTLMPSRKSDIKAIESALEDVYQRIMAVDVAAIAADVRALLQSGNQLLSDPRVGRILTNFEKISAAGGGLAENLERMTKDVELRPTVQNIEQVTADVRALAAELRQGLSGGRVGEAVAQIGTVAENVQQFLLGLQTAVARLDRTLGNLERLSENVRSQPSLLLFAEPPEPHHPGSGGRR
jgi:phospholipid/cholesterol/gamma-HCH transport system substrate-binding protein